MDTDQETMLGPSSGDTMFHPEHGHGTISGHSSNSSHHTGIRYSVITIIIIIIIIIMIMIIIIIIIIIIIYDCL